MNMLISAVRDLDSGVTTVVLDGEFTIAAMGRVRSALLVAAGECPTAVIVDLSALVLTRRSLLRLFPNAVRKAMADHGVPVLLYAPPEEIARGLAPFRDLISVYPDRAAALSALTATTPRWVHGRMDADPIGVSWARNLVGEACLGWGLPHLLGPARRVTSELAQNAVEHAASPFDVTIAATARYLRIGVQDRSVNPPCLLHDLSPDPHAPLADRGCGLRIVTDTASRWGTTPLADGKIVWALLPVDPVPAGPIARVGSPAVRRHPRGASGKPVTYPQGMRRSVAPMTYP